MSYPGWGFLVVLGVAIGSVIYYYFNNESNHHRHEYTNENASNERRSHLRGENCTICLDSLGNFRRIRTLPCGHIFHEHCISMWLNRKNLCPVCRVAI